MALFKGRSIHALFPKYFQCVLNKTKRYKDFRPFNYCKNLSNECVRNFTPILSLNRSQILKNVYCADFSSSSKSINGKPLNLDSLVDYENVSEETLQSLYDRFEEVLQNSSFEDSDVNYSNGVLTITLEKSCVYVINKQTPNRQIWLSSPVSGPKRYDYIDGMWIYKHDKYSLHQLLTDELTHLLQKDADFLICDFGT